MGRMKKGSMFNQLGLDEYLDREKKVWSTPAVCEALNKTLHEPTTERKILYRVKTKKFSPLPERIGASYVWSYRSVNALADLLFDEYLSVDIDQDEELMRLYRNKKLRPPPSPAPDKPAT